MNLNKDIIDFKEPELRKKVDRIQYEREMTSIAIFLFLEKIYQNNLFTLELVNKIWSTLQWECL